MAKLGFYYDSSKQKHRVVLMWHMPIPMNDTIVTQIPEFIANFIFMWFKNDPKKSCEVSNFELMTAVAAPISCCFA